MSREQELEAQVSRLEAANETLEAEGIGLQESITVVGERLEEAQAANDALAAALGECQQLAIERVKTADAAVKTDIYAADALMGIATIARRALSDTGGGWPEVREQARKALDNYIKLEVGQRLAIYWKAQWLGYRSTAQFSEILRQRDLAFDTLRAALDALGGTA